MLAPRCLLQLFPASPCCHPSQCLREVDHPCHHPSPHPAGTPWPPPLVQRLRFPWVPRSLPCHRHCCTPPSFLSVTRARPHRCGHPLNEGRCRATPGCCSVALHIRCCMAVRDHCRTAVHARYCMALCSHWGMAVHARCCVAVRCCCLLAGGGRCGMAVHSPGNMAAHTPHPRHVRTARPPAPQVQ